MLPKIFGVNLNGFQFRNDNQEKDFKESLKKLNSAIHKFEHQDKDTPIPPLPRQKSTTINTKINKLIKSFIDKEFKLENLNNIEDIFVELKNVQKLLQAQHVTRTNRSNLKSNINDSIGPLENKIIDLYIEKHVSDLKQRFTQLADDETLKTCIDTELKQNSFSEVKQNYEETKQKYETLIREYLGVKEFAEVLYKNDNFRETSFKKELSDFKKFYDIVESNAYSYYLKQLIFSDGSKEEWHDSIENKLTPFYKEKFSNELKKTYPNLHNQFEAVIEDNIKTLLDLESQKTKIKSILAIYTLKQYLKKDSEEEKASSSLDSFFKFTLQKKDDDINTLKNTVEEAQGNSQQVLKDVVEKFPLFPKRDELIFEIVQPLTSENIKEQKTDLVNKIKCWTKLEELAPFLNKEDPKKSKLQQSFKAFCKSMHEDGLELVYLTKELETCKKNTQEVTNILKEKYPSLVKKDLRPAVGHPITDKNKEVVFKRAKNIIDAYLTAAKLNTFLGPKNSLAIKLNQPFSKFCEMVTSEPLQINLEQEAGAGSDGQGILSSNLANLNQKLQEVSAQKLLNELTIEFPEFLQQLNQGKSWILEQTNDNSFESVKATLQKAIDVFGLVKEIQVEDLEHLDENKIDLSSWKQKSIQEFYTIFKPKTITEDTQKKIEAVKKRAKKVTEFQTKKEKLLGEYDRFKHLIRNTEFFSSAESLTEDLKTNIDTLKELTSYSEIDNHLEQIRESLKKAVVGFENTHYLNNKLDSMFKKVKTGSFNALTLFNDILESEIDKLSALKTVCETFVKKHSSFKNLINPEFFKKHSPEDIVSFLLDDLTETSVSKEQKLSFFIHLKTFEGQNKSEGVTQLFDEFKSELEAQLKSEFKSDFMKKLLSQIEKENPEFVGLRLEKDVITKDKKCIEGMTKEMNVENIESDSIKDQIKGCLNNDDDPIILYCGNAKDEHTLLLYCDYDEDIFKENFTRNETHKTNISITKTALNCLRARVLNPKTPAYTCIETLLQFTPRFKKTGNKVEFENYNFGSENSENKYLDLLKQYCPFEFDEIQKKIQDCIKKLLSNPVDSLGIKEGNKVNKYIQDKLNNAITNAEKFNKAGSAVTQSDIKALQLFEESLEVYVGQQKDILSKNSKVQAFEKLLHNIRGDYNLFFRYAAGKIVPYFNRALEKLSSPVRLDNLGIQFTKKPEKFLTCKKEDDAENILFDFGVALAALDKCKTFRRHIQLLPHEQQLATQLQLLPGTTQAYSLSDTVKELIKPTGLKDDLNSKLLNFMTHMFLDPDAQKSSFEGSNHDIIMSVLHGFLTELDLKKLEPKTQTELGSLKESINSGLECYEIFTKLHSSKDDQVSPEEKFKQLITNLKEETYLLIPFGYEKHATYLKIVKEKNNTYTVQHYNLGGGCNRFQKKKWSSKDNQYLYFPYTQVTQVKEDDLLNPVFLNSIYQVLFGRTEKKIICSEGTLSLLTEKTIDIFDKKDLDLNRAQVIQHSGFCSYHSLRALIKDTLSAQQYAKFEVLLGLKTMYSFNEYCNNQKEGLRLPNLSTLRLCILRFQEMMTPQLEHLSSEEKEAIIQTNELLTRVEEKIALATQSTIIKLEPEQKLLDLSLSFDYNFPVQVEEKKTKVQNILNFPKIETIEEVNTFLSNIKSECEAILKTEEGYNHVLLLINNALLQLPDSDNEVYKNKDFNLDNLIELSKYALQCWQKESYCDFNHRTQVDFILLQAKVLLITVENLRNKFKDYKISPEKQEGLLSKEQAFANLIFSIQSDVHKKLKGAFSAEAVFGNSGLYDVFQVALYQKLKLHSLDFKEEPIEGVKQTPLFETYEEITLQNEDFENDQGFGVHPLVTFIKACFPDTEATPETYLNLLTSPDPKTPGGKNVNATLTDDYYWFINALQHFSLGVKSEKLKNVSFHLDPFDPKTLKVPSDSVRNKNLFNKKSHPQSILHKGLLAICELKTLAKDKKTDYLRFKGSVENRSFSKEMTEKLLQLVSFDSEEAVEDHGLYFSKLIGVFSSRKDLLSKDQNKKEFREFFKQLLFVEALNDKTLNSYNECAPTIKSFLQGSYEAFKDQNDYNACAYFLKIMVLLQSRPNNFKSLPCLEKLNSLINDVEKSSGEQKKQLSFYLHQLRVCYFYQTQSIEGNEALYLKSLTYISTPLQNNPFLDTDIEGICEKAKVWFAFNLKSYLIKDANSKNIDSDVASSSWAFDDSSQMFTATYNEKNYEFDCVTGKLLIDKTQTGLPEKLLINDTFNRIFPKELGSHADLEFEKNCENYIFTLSKKSKRKIIFRNADTGFDVSYKVGSTTYVYKKELKYLPKDLADRHLIFIEPPKPDMVASKSSEAKGVLLDISSKEVAYNANLVHEKDEWGNLKVIFKSVESLNNLKLKRYEKTSFRCLFNIDKHAEFYQSDDNKSALIKLPTLGLEFKKTGPKFLCQAEDLKEYWIDETQYLRGLDGLTSYLRLTNGTDTKFIFPSSHIIVDVDEANKESKTHKVEEDSIVSTTYKFDLNKKLDKLLPDYFVLNENEFVTDSVVESPDTHRLNDLFLLYMCCTTENYNQAFNLVSHRIIDQRRLTDKEIAVINSIFKALKNNRACQTSIKLKLCAKLIRIYPLELEGIKNPDNVEDVTKREELKKLNPIFFQTGIESSLTSYLDLVHSSQGLKLYEEDEKQLLYFCRDYGNLTNEIKKRFEFFGLPLNTQEESSPSLKPPLKLDDKEYSFDLINDDKPSKNPFDVQDVFLYNKKRLCDEKKSQHYKDAKKWLKLVTYIYPNHPLVRALIILDEEGVDICDGLLEKNSLGKEYINREDLNEKIYKYYLDPTKIRELEDLEECFKHKEALVDPSHANHAKAETWYKKVQTYFPDAISNIKTLYEKQLVSLSPNEEEHSRINKELDTLKEISSTFNPEKTEESDEEMRVSTTEPTLKDSKINDSLRNETRLQLRSSQRVPRLDLPKKLAKSMFDVELDDSGLSLEKKEDSAKSKSLTSLEEDKQIYIEKVISQNESLRNTQVELKKVELKKAGAKPLTKETKQAYFVVSKNQYHKLKKSIQKGILDRANKEIVFSKSTHKRLELNQLIHAFSKHTQEAYLDLNSTLSIQDCQWLHQEILEYLVCSKQINKLNRIQQLTMECHEIQETKDKLQNGLEEAPKAIPVQLDVIKTMKEQKQLQLKLLKSTLIDLHEECQIDWRKKNVSLTELYVPTDYPEFLVFEAKTGMSLRKSQVAKLKEMYKEMATDPPDEKIHQMIMGFGKTKVILPILANKKADGKKLSTIIVPDSLIEDVKKDLNKKSSGVYGQAPFTFEFDRSTSLAELGLETLKSTLENSITKRNPVVTTSKSMHCLRLCLIEQIKKYEDTTQNCIQSMCDSGNSSQDCTQKDALKVEAEKLFNYFEEFHLNLLNQDPNYITQGDNLIKYLNKELSQEKNKELYDYIDTFFSKRNPQVPPEEHNKLITDFTIDKVEGIAQGRYDELKNKIIYETKTYNYSKEDIESLLKVVISCYNKNPESFNVDEEIETFRKKMGLTFCFGLLNKTEPVRKSATKLQEIVLIFKTKAAATFDEADTILNCKNEVNFTIGKKIKPKPEELIFLVKLHRILTKCPEDTDYKTFIWSRIKADNACLGPEVEAAKTGLGDDCFKSFLLDKKMLTQVELNSLTPAQQSVIYLLKEQLGELLEVTYKRKIDENYGAAPNDDKDKDKDEYHAVPYVALNTPSLSSRFDQIHEILNYTNQMYLNEGTIPKWILKEHLQAIYDQVKEDEFKNITYDESDAKKELERFFPHLQEDTRICNQGQLDTLVDEIQIEFKEDDLDRYLAYYILPKIDTNDTTLNSNSFDIVDMFCDVQGFTGTPWNEKTLHRRLGCTHDKGTDGESLVSLEKASIKYLESDTNYKSLIEELDFSSPKHALIDCGALMRGAPNKEIAEELLKKVTSQNPEIKSIVFYHNKVQTEGYLDSKGNFKIVDYKKERSNPSKRFTFYDNEHTVGADIGQANNAKAVVTLAENMKQRDLFQAIWRMRGLSKTQTLELVLNKKLNKKLKEKIKGIPHIDDILRIVKENEDKQVVSQTVQASKAQITHIKRNFEFNEVLNTPVHKLRVGAVEPFIKHKDIDPATMYVGNKSIEKKEVQITQWAKLLDGWQEKESHEQTLKAVLKLASDRLPEEIEVPVKAHDETAEIEQEKEQENENENENENETYGYITWAKHEQLKPEQVKNAILGEGNDPVFKDVTFGNRLFKVKTSKNFEKLPIASSSSTPQFESTFRCPCQHVFVYRYTENGKEKKGLVMLHEFDVETFIANLKTGRSSLNEFEFAVLHLSHTQTQQNCLVSHEIENLSEWVDASVQKQLIEVKLFNGEIYLSPPEIDLFFKEMTSGNKQKWLEFIKTYSLEKNNLDEKAFYGTKLGKALKSS